MFFFPPSQCDGSKCPERAEISETIGLLYRFQWVAIHCTGVLTDVLSSVYRWDANQLMFHCYKLYLV